MKFRIERERLHLIESTQILFTLDLAGNFKSVDAAASTDLKFPARSSVKRICVLSIKCRRSRSILNFIKLYCCVAPVANRLRVSQPQWLAKRVRAKTGSAKKKGVAFN